MSDDGNASDFMYEQYQHLKDFVNKHGEVEMSKSQNNEYQFLRKALVVDQRGYDKLTGYEQNFYNRHYNDYIGKYPELRDIHNPHRGIRSGPPPGSPHQGIRSGPPLPPRGDKVPRKQATPPIRKKLTAAEKDAFQQTYSPKKTSLIRAPSLVLNLAPQSLQNRLDQALEEPQDRSVNIIMDNEYESEFNVQETEDDYRRELERRALPLEQREKYSIALEDHIMNNRPGPMPEPRDWVLDEAAAQRHPRRVGAVSKRGAKRVGAKRSEAVGRGPIRTKNSKGSALKLLLVNNLPSRPRINPILTSNMPKGQVGSKRGKKPSKRKTTKSKKRMAMSYSTDSYTGSENLPKALRQYRPTPALDNALSTTFGSLNEYTKELVAMILDPDQCLSPHRWPNTYGLSGLFKTKDVIQAKFTPNTLYDGTSRSAIVVYPCMKNSIFVTQGSTDPVAFTLPAHHVLTANYAVYQPQLTIGTNDYVYIGAPWIKDNNALFPTPMNIAQSNTVSNLIYPIAWNTLGDGARTSPCMTIYAPTALGNQLRICVSIFSATGDGNPYGNIVQTFLQTPVYDQAYVDIPMSPTPAIPAVPNNITGFSVCVQNIGDNPYDGQPFSWYITQDTGGGGGTLVTAVQITNTAQWMTSMDVHNADTITTNTTTYIPLAQSLLGTFEGSSLNNAGVIASARLPTGQAPGLTYGDSPQSWYQWLADIPKNSFNGPVKKGTYSWYLGCDEASYFYRPVETQLYDQMDYIMAEATTNDTTNTTLRWQISSIFQYMTINPAFNTEASCYIGPDLDRLRWILSNIPSSYENASHREQLTSMLRNVGNRAVGLLKDPNTYVNAAKVLGTIAKFVA